MLATRAKTSCVCINANGLHLNRSSVVFRFCSWLHFICRTWNVYTFTINLIRCYWVSDFRNENGRIHNCQYAMLVIVDVVVVATWNFDLYQLAMWSIFTSTKIWNLSFDFIAQIFIAVHFLFLPIFFWFVNHFRDHRPFFGRNNFQNYVL